MQNYKIITLLSNNRDRNNPTRPATLSKTTIVSLVKGSISPNQSQDDLHSEVQRNLEELEARGEILAGKGNHYCIAPPTLLAQSEDDCKGLLFRGDRAYLALAHEVLKTNSDQDEVNIYSQIRTFDRMKLELDRVGIHLMTADRSVEYLPLPRTPLLRRSAPIPDFSNDSILCYEPIPDIAQKERWQPVREILQLSDGSLLKLCNEDYFWFVGGEFYELERPIATLAMFYKDRENNSPLRVYWDSSEGRLDLQDVYLPDTYMRFLWQLSGETERYRIRTVPYISRPLVESVLKRLGCQLV